jgi:hypothetical protein
MALTIRIPKAGPKLDREAARAQAQVEAKAKGHRPHD